MSMNGQMETKLGKVTIDPEVIALYAGSVAVECFGIVGMAAETVRYKVEEFTGMEIEKINIYVEGVRVID